MHFHPSSAVCSSRRSARLRKSLLAGELSPRYDVDRDGVGLSVVEKIIARKAWRGGEEFNLFRIS